MTNGLDNSNTGALFDRPIRPDATPRCRAISAVRNRWFNTTAFVQNALGTHGNVGRNTLDSPGILQWDFSTLKDFMFTERYRLQFRFEAFNAANHPNWGNPNTNIASNTFRRKSQVRATICVICSLR